MLQPRLTLFLILCLSYALRLHGLTLQNIWWDEARNIDVALRPFWEIPTAPELDIHPPLYFWLLHGWGRLTDLVGILSDRPRRLNPEQIAFLMRWISVAAGVISVALIFQLIQKIAFSSLHERRMGGLCAAAIAALSPFWLAESQETRMYTVGFALLLAAALVLLSLIDSQERLRHRSPNPETRRVFFEWTVAQTELRWNRMLPFVFLSAAAFLTHYNTLFILVSWYLWWIVFALFKPNRRQIIHTIMLTGLITATLVAPITPIVLRQIPTYANPNLVIPTMAEYLIQNWQAYLAGYAFPPQWIGEGIRSVGLFWLGFMALLLVLGLTIKFVFSRTAYKSIHKSTIREPSERNLMGLTFLLTWLIGGLMIFFIVVLDRGTFNVRYSSFVTPSLYALLGIAIGSLSKIHRMLMIAGLVFYGIGAVPAVYADLYDERFAREDMGAVTRWLDQTTREGDVILVDQKYPFGFYYSRYVTKEGETPIGHEAAPAYYLFVDINTIDQRLSALAGEAERVFWIQWFESDTDPRRSVPFLLDQTGTRAGEEEFRGYEIDWWELTPPNRFTLASNLTSINYRFPPALQTIAVALPESIPAGEEVPVTIRWARLDHNAIDRPLKARMALYQIGGSKILGQNDRRILNDRHRMPSEWALADQPLNVYALPTSADLEVGLYEVRLLVYDAETLEPLSYLDKAGNPAGVEVVLAQIQVTESTK